MDRFELSHKNTNSQQIAELKATVKELRQIIEEVLQILRGEQD